MNATTIRRIINAEVRPDRVTVSKDGLVTVRRAYFYRHGMTPADLRDRVLLAFPDAEIVACRDDYASWPRQSWFTVAFRLPGFPG